MKPDPARSALTGKLSLLVSALLLTTPALAAPDPAPAPGAAAPSASTSAAPSGTTAPSGSAAFPAPAVPGSSAAPATTAPPTMAPSAASSAPAPARPVPAKAPAAAASSAPALPPQPTIVNGAAANLQPFGPGTRVTVKSSKLVKVYVARARPDGSAPSEYDFTRVGTAPLVLELPPGKYVLAVENDDVSSASHSLRVGGQPIELDVNPGSSGVGEVGTLSLAIGSLAVLAASAILLSGSEAPAGIDKKKLVIPMYAAGGGLVIGGLTMFLVTRTSIDERPGPMAPGPAPRGPEGLALRAQVTF